MVAEAALWAFSLLQPDELVITQCESLWEIDLHDQNVPAELSSLSTHSGRVRDIWICNEWCSKECERSPSSTAAAAAQYHQCIVTDEDSDTDSGSVSESGSDSHSHSEGLSDEPKQKDGDQVIMRMLDAYTPQDSDIPVETPENGDRIMPYVVGEGQSLRCCCSPTFTVP